jgi:hypothetical protein
MADAPSDGTVSNVQQPPRYIAMAFVLPRANGSFPRTRY